MWRGYRDLGAALTNIAGRNQSTAELGQRLSTAAPGILKDFRASMQASVMPGSYPRCYPYVAGAETCDELNATQAGSARASEAWRTYSEAFYSGGVEESVAKEIVAWHQLNGKKGSRVKLGVLTGSGGDVASTGALETFTIHGWGYGLLQHDMVEAFLLQFFALSAHCYTRGTFVAPESAMLDRTQTNVPFATPAGPVSYTHLTLPTTPYV